jgi:hypothetical protein
VCQALRAAAIVERRTQALRGSVPLLLKACTRGTFRVNSGMPPTGIEPVHEV